MYSMTNKDYYVYSSKRAECPLCGSKDGRADIILDKRTNVAYNENVGYFKCHSCGGVQTPGYEDKYSNEEWRNMEKQKINPNPKPQPKQKTANEIKAILNSNYNDSMANQNSNFHNWINNLSRDLTAFDTMEIGTDKQNNTNFWYRDIEGNLAFSKTMAYSIDGDRLKEDENPIKKSDGTAMTALSGYCKSFVNNKAYYEMHSNKFGFTSDGVFNYNRLIRGDYESIFVLESEKNCVLASILMPEYCFVTGGGSNAFAVGKSAIVEKFATKFNKNVFVLYDLDDAGFKNSNSVCSREYPITNYTQIFDEFIKSKKQIEIKVGYDVADFCKLVFERKIKKMHLIKELDKIFNSYFETEKPKKEQTSKSLIIMDKMKNFLADNYKFRFNVIKTRYEYCINDYWTWVNDRSYNTMFNQMMSQGIEADFNKMVRYIESEASPEFNPFEEFLKRQPDYDIHKEPNYIQQIADLIEVERENIVPRDDYFKRWFIGIYQQATLKTCSQFILIFVGSGGIGKDQFANSLLPKELKEYVADFDFMNVDKDAKLCMCNSIILNCAELENLNKADQAKVKKTIGENYFVLRPAYARVSQRIERRGSFIGSANLSTILADETGSRRYLVMESSNIKWQDIDEYLITRAYKQAEYETLLGYNIHFTQEEIKVVNEYNEQFRNISLPETLIMEHFKPTKEHEDGMTSNKLLTVLMTYNNNMKEYHNAKLGAILKKLGYTSKSIRIDGATQRPYNITEKVNIGRFKPEYSQN